MNSDPRLLGLASRTAVLFAVLCGTSAPGSAQDVPGEQSTGVEAARTILGKLVETRRILSAERRDWRVGKALLQDQIEMAKSQIEELRKKVARQEELIGKVGKEKLELDTENEALIASAEKLETSLVPLETSIRRLLVRLPDKIRDQVKPLSQRIPDHGPVATAKSDVPEGAQWPASTGHDEGEQVGKDGARVKAEPKKIDLGERFRNLIGSLNMIDKFNTEVTVSSEVRKLANGSTAEVSAIYFGVGQAYFVTAKGDHAEYGTSTAKGWESLPFGEELKQQAAKHIAQAIAIFRNEQPAAFVPLPIRIH